MFLLFKNKKSQKQQWANDAKDRIAAGIVHSCIRVQERSATFLQRQTNRLSTPLKKFLLMLFILMSAGYSFYLITEGSISHNPFRIAFIKIPKQAGTVSEKNAMPVMAVTTQDHQKIQGFMHYLDSLTKTSSGKKMHDGILKSHPLLLDSLRLIENIYQLQSSKK